MVALPALAVPATQLCRTEKFPMKSLNDPRQNQLLAALPAADYARLLPDLEFTPMPLEWSVYESGMPMEYIYFPTTCIVSLLYVMENGESAEIAITGNEGLVGIALFMGGESTSSRAVVQRAGACYRLKQDILKREFEQGGSLQQLALRFTQALIAQMVQTGACNRHHSLEQQLCRWLLLSLDRLPGREVSMTQQLIANMLGVRRVSVTEAAGKLQKAGLIRYRRGRITVLNRRKLEERACECYRVVKNELQRLAATEFPLPAGIKRRLAGVTALPVPAS
jgi:CRP-like cAMP-binding protein